MTEKKIFDKFDKKAEVVFYEGDTLEFLPTIPDNSVQLIVTSPPYNLGKPYETKINFENYLAQQKKVITECYRILSEHGSICWQVGNYVNNGEIIPLDIALFPIFSELGLHLRNRIIWYFGHGLHASKRFSGRYEVILWFTKSDNYVFNLDDVRIPQKYPEKKYFKGPKKGQLSGNPLGKNPSDIWEIPNVKANHIEKTIHPCQFPVELIERLVLALSNDGDIVLDPFMGVGSTAIASLMHNRKTFGADIMKEYITIAKDRVKQANEGKLLIRPMERPIYSASSKDTYIPPSKIDFNNQEQPRLLEKKENFDVGEDSFENRL
jgi:adenine-specific DNA-methyltransferase